MQRRTIYKESAKNLSQGRRMRKIIACNSREANAPTQPEYRTHADKAAVVEALSDVLGLFR